MLNYDMALAEARKKKSKINHCVEYNNAFVFSYEQPGVEMVGGESPIVILKETGEALNMISYATGFDHEFVRECEV